MKYVWYLLFFGLLINGSIVDIIKLILFKELEIIRIEVC